MKERWVQLVALVAFLLLWHGVAVAVGTHLVPSPANVAPSLWTILESGRFVEPLLTTVLRTMLGFLLAFLGGIAYGVAAGRSPTFAAASWVLFDTAMYVPSLAVIFLGVIMLGTTEIAIILIVGLLTFAAIGAYMRDVVKDLDPDVIGMADAFKVTRSSKMLDIYVPYLIPAMLASARIGVTSAWKIVLLTEVLGFPSGLGWQIRLSYASYDLARLIAWLVIFIAVLLLIEQVIRISEQRIVRWQ